MWGHSAKAVAFNNSETLELPQEALNRVAWGGALKDFLGGLSASS